MFVSRGVSAGAILVTEMLLEWAYQLYTAHACTLLSAGVAPSPPLPGSMDLLWRIVLTLTSTSHVTCE